MRWPSLLRRRNPDLWPLLVLSVGRAGSTLTMRLLGTHPGLVVHPAHPHEMMLIGLLCHREHPIAGNVSSLRRYPFPGVHAFRARAEAGEIDSLAVRAAYRRLARQLGKEPLGFVEKLRPDVGIDPVVEALPDVRILLLLRDPRDVLASVRAFDRRRNRRSFFEHEGDLPDDTVRRYRERHDHILDAATKVPSRVLRYEDLVRDPRPTLTGLLDWLGLESDASTVSAMLAAAAETPSTHRTASSTEGSIGRWRRDLEPEVVIAFDRHFADFLARFGYV